MYGTNGTPVPKREIEEMSRGSGPVITYKLTPRQLEIYLATGQIVKEEEKMSLTRDEYLKLRYKGRGRTEIMRNHFNGNTQVFYRQLQEWGIKEKDAEERELDMMAASRKSSIEPDTSTAVQPADEQTRTPILLEDEPDAASSKPIETAPHDIIKQLENLYNALGVTNAIRAVIDERRRQDAKWGVHNHAPHYWSGILGEEFGELCEAINETVFDNGAEARAKGGYENMRREAVQVAAVAIGFIEALDRRYAPA